MAMYFSGRIKAYEYCIDKILEFKKKYNVVLFCSLNCGTLTDYERRFFELCEMTPEQYRYENVVMEDWMYSLDRKGQSCRRISIYSQFLNNKKCMELIENYEKNHNVRFEYIIKYRADIYSDTILPLYHMEPNTIYMPDIEIYCNMNDQIAYGLRDTMKIYSGAFDNIRKLCLEKGVACHPESILVAQLNTNNVQINVFPFNYKLHEQRHEYTYF